MKSPRPKPRTYRFNFERMSRLFHWLLCGLFVCAACVQAQAEYFTITRYQVTVTLNAEGHADFEEVIEVQFTQPRHGIFRHIPLRSVLDGKKVDRLIRKVEVEGFKFKTSRKNHNLVIKIGDPDEWVEGAQTYRIRYTVLNPLDFFEENSQFYWDLLGVAWPVVTERFEFALHFPGGIRLQEDDVRVFTGASGAQGEDALWEVTSNVIEGYGTRKFMPEEGLTVAVRLPRDAFKPMEGLTYFLKRHGLLLAIIPFLSFGLYGFSKTRNKKEVITTEYFPPEGISPAVAGGFVDHSVDPNDILCLIPHLANQGYLRLEMKPGGFLKKMDVTFYKLKEASDDLMPFEKHFFQHLFSTGDVVDLDSLRNKFYMHMAGLQSEIKAWIKAQGWYETHQDTLGCMTIAAALVVAAWGGIALFAFQNMDGIALLGTGLLLFILSFTFNKRTESGNETYRRLEGFREFVDKAERPIIERLMQEDPHYYDKTMPFALAFGYLKKWNRHFEGLLTQPPSWYGSPGMYGSSPTQGWQDFSERFPTEISQIGSVFSSSPSSSGGGSGGGGGSSGGGSGGGGGGSW